MFQLLQPIWLFALAGLAVPVIIHLWNQRPGKTLRVGSVALVAENALTYRKRVQLSEILLLILRCLLLGCIALALSKPFLRKPIKNTGRGWVLMNRVDLPATYNRFKPVVDSLLLSGMEFHYFEPGFAKEHFNDAVKAVPDSTQTSQSSYRAITALLNQQVDARLPLYVFTDNSLQHFSGSRTAASLNLHWFAYTRDTASSRKLIDTTALYVTIFSRSYINDARYLKAALDAVQQFSKRNIFTKLVTTVPGIPAKQDWLFWLDDDMIPKDKVAANIFAYADGKPVPNISYILPAGKWSFAAVSLYKSVIAPDTLPRFFDTGWNDGFGHPLLTVQLEPNKANYKLYTHFDPAWNELPWSESFPELLYQLLYAGHEQVKVAAADNTIIDSTQLMPVLVAEKEAGPKPTLFAETKLTFLFWVMAFVLFFAERCLSFYHRKKSANG
ncbi:MAG: BatA domain-containing protein [Chitinophagaceae bacterium]